MKTKPVIKSKTINSILVIAVIVILNLLGIGEAEIGKTYDTITSNTSKTETTKDLVTLAAAGMAFYGRMNAKTKLGGKGDGDED